MDLHASAWEASIMGASQSIAELFLDASDDPLSNFRTHKGRPLVGQK